MAEARGRRWQLLLAVMASTGASAATPAVPAALASNLPGGYTVMSAARSRPDAAHDFTFVVLASTGEQRRWGTTDAPPRPLLVFRKIGVRYRQVARNDHVVLRADEGGQCDPFEDGGLAAKGRYVTIENSVACGQHWTDYVTFRFEPATGGYVFDNRRVQSWRFNPDRRPDADALVPDGDRVERAQGRPVSLAQWRRRS
jgi:hypothetical protein